MIIEVCSGNRSRGIEGWDLVGAVSLISTLDHSTICTESPNREGTVRGMASDVVGKYRGRDESKVNDILVKSTIVEEDMPPLVVVLENFAQGGDRFWINAGPVGRDGSGWWSRGDWEEIVDG